MSEDMKRDVDCLVFGDQLDALIAGSLSEEGKRQLYLHAEGCADCGMQLRVHEHLAHPSLEALEARVPEPLLASVWEGVQGGLAAPGRTAEWTGKGARGGGGRVGRSAPIPSGWLMPALAAAALLLLFSTGLLSLELGRARAREAVLAQQVTEQRRWLGALDPGAGADPVARTAALAGRTPWLRALSREESITLEGLRTLLERMPGDRVVMTESQLEAALGGRSPLTTPLLREVLEEARGERGAWAGAGLRARDLLQVLEGLDASPDQAVPTSDLLQLLS